VPAPTSVLSQSPCGWTRTPSSARVTAGPPPRGRTRRAPAAPR
jgi:hypothetical protein